jgi:hypothetical protein
MYATKELKEWVVRKSFFIFIISDKYRKDKKVQKIFEKVRKM